MKTKTYYKKKELKRKNCKKFTPLYYTKFHGVKSVYNKKIRRFFRNRYKDIFALKKSFRGLKVKYFLKELREYAKEHEYDLKNIYLCEIIYIFILIFSIIQYA